MQNQNGTTLTHNINFDSGNFASPIAPVRNYIQANSKKVCHIPKKFAAFFGSLKVRKSHNVHFQSHKFHIRAQAVKLSNISFFPEKSIFLSFSRIFHHQTSYLSHRAVLFPASKTQRQTWINGFKSNSNAEKLLRAHWFTSTS